MTHPYLQGLAAACLSVTPVGKQTVLFASHGFRQLRERKQDSKTMADRLFERAFSRAAASGASEGAERPMQPQKQSMQAEAGAADKEPAAPMQVSDAVQRVLLADQDKDYFRYILQVCRPLLKRCCSVTAVSYLLVSIVFQRGVACLVTDSWSCHSLKQMSLGAQS